MSSSMLARAGGAWPAQVEAQVDFSVKNCSYQTGGARVESDLGELRKDYNSCMLGPETESRIYLLDDDQRGLVPDGPAVIRPDGVREEIPELVYRAVQHVLDAMRAGRAVQVIPLRTELPIDEAADALGIARDVLRKHVGAGEIPFRSSEYVDWVKLADVINWDNDRIRRRRAILDEMMADDPADDES
ncbi:hypothetical protein [Kribbella sp. NPDC000426]|uniref:hypothetical protein n=1 Tax=Kribbella sp. NPDC000426 TaxID=3154255 RepID=UPI0033251328